MRAKPAGMENDLYNYHLKQLIKKGLVEKREGIYSLTTDGKVFSHRVDSAGRAKEFIKCALLLGLFEFRENETRALAQQRKRHPLYGTIGIHAGTIRRGESILDAARRKFVEETGLEAEFTLMGIREKAYLFNCWRNS